MILQFDVINQRVVRKDNNYVVANSQFYLQMDFNFTTDWQGFGKTITFVGSGKKYSIGLNAQDSCIVPYDVIKTPSFSFSIKGILDDVIITTNICVVAINPSGETKGVAPTPPPKEILDGLQNGLSGQVLGKLSDDNYDYEFQDLKDLKYDDDYSLGEKINELESGGIQDIFYQDQKLWKRKEETNYEIVELYTKEEIDTLLENLDQYIEKSETPGLIKNDGTVDTTQYLSSIPDTYIQKSDTSGLIKNDGTIDTNTYALSSDLSNEVTARENADNLLVPKTTKVAGITLGQDTDNLQNYIYDANQTLKQKVDAMSNDISGKQSALSQTQLDATNSGINANKVANYDAHVGNTNNPHSVTASQVGLGNVVNSGDSATPSENGTDKFTTGGAYTMQTALQNNINTKVQEITKLNVEITNWFVNDNPNYANYGYVSNTTIQDLVDAKFVNVSFSLNDLEANVICPIQEVDTDNGILTIYSNDNSTITIPYIYIFK